MAYDIARELRRKLPDDDSVEVYTRDEIPSELHWSQNPYCPPVLVLAKVGTVILRAGARLQRPESDHVEMSGMSYYDTSRVLEMTQQGLSGYDPEEPDMRGVFMARGPGFKTGGQYLSAIRVGRRLRSLLPSPWNRTRAQRRRLGEGEGAAEKLGSGSDVAQPHDDRARCTRDSGNDIFVENKHLGIKFK